MRSIVLEMMTTVDGRLDDPMAWVHGVSDDQYRDIHRVHDRFDTVLVGRTTYEEMAAYWPAALASGEGTEQNRRMARRMHDYRKLVFSRSGERPLTPWHNVELVVTPTAEALADCLAGLKTQPGGDLHLAGGAGFARSVVSLGLVDEFRLFAYPTVSRGVTWHGGLPDGYRLELAGATTYGNGVVGLDYRASTEAPAARPGAFTELLR